MNEDYKQVFVFGPDDEFFDDEFFDVKFGSVDELIAFVENAWKERETNKDFFRYDKDKEWHSKICVGIGEPVSVSFYAPTVQDIIDSITESYNIVTNYKHKGKTCEILTSMEKLNSDYVKILNSNLVLPGRVNMVACWFGCYDVDKHDWVEKYPGFEKYVK